MLNYNNNNSNNPADAEDVWEKLKISYEALPRLK